MSLDSDKKWCQLMPAGIRLHECLFRFMSGVMKGLFRGYVALWTLTLTRVLASFWRLHLFSLDSTQRDLEKRTGTLEEPYSEFLQNSLVIFYLYRYLTDPRLCFCSRTDRQTRRSRLLQRTKEFSTVLILKHEIKYFRYLQNLGQKHSRFSGSSAVRPVEEEQTV